MRHSSQIDCIVQMRRGVSGFKFIEPITFGLRDTSFLLSRFWESRNERPNVTNRAWFKNSEQNGHWRPPCSLMRGQTEYINRK